MVEKRKISTHTKNTKGVPVTSRSGQTTYTKSTKEGIGMYVFIYGTGSNKKSITRHCSEAEADRILADLSK